jgi:hypothetical protein
MKLIAGTILAVGGFLVIALGNLSIYQALSPWSAIGDTYYLSFKSFTLGSPIEIVAMFFIIFGVVLITWAIGEAIRKKE